MTAIDKIQGPSAKSLDTAVRPHYESSDAWHAKREDMYGACDVVTLNCPLHSETEHMINDETLKLFRRGAYLVNTARGKLCDREAIVRAWSRAR